MEEENKAASPEQEQPSAGSRSAVQQPTAIPRPKLFRKADESVRIEVTGYYSRQTGDFEFALAGDTHSGMPGENYVTMLHEFRFSPVPYNRLNFYRSQSTTTDAEGRQSLDRNRLNDYFWTFHLQGWNFPGEDGQPIELKHDPDGTLTNGSLELLYSLPASMLDLVMGLFRNALSIP